MLEPIAEQVTIVHRRDKFRAHEHSVEKSNQFPRTCKKTPYVPVELIGDDNIKRVVVQHVQTGESITIDVDDVIVNYGFVSSLGPIKDWGLSIEKTALS
ncbi:hypothetical protein GCM10020331_029160 [Ectobacillus funiculus]